MNISYRIIKKWICFLPALNILIIFFTGVSSLYAQAEKTWMGNELNQRINEAKLNLGPLKVRPILYLTAGHDSNIFMSPDNPIKDYSANVGPGFYIYCPIKKTIVLSVYESPQYVYYVETKNGRTWNNYFNGKIHFFIRRLFLTFGKGYSSASELWNMELESRPRRKEDSLEGSILYQLSKRISLFFRYFRAKYDYKTLFDEQFNNINDMLNRVEDRSNFTIYYQPSYRVRFFLNFEYGFFNFTNPLNYRDSESYSIFSGFDFSPVGIFKGRISLGYKYFNTFKSGFKNYRGIVGDTSVSIRPMRALSIRARYERNVDFSIWHDNPYFLSENLGGGLSLYFLKDIRLDYDYNLGRYIYPKSELITPGSEENRRDNYNIQSAGIYFRVKKNIGVGVTLNQWVRDSKLDKLNTKRTFIGLNLTYDF